MYIWFVYFPHLKWFVSWSNCKFVYLVLFHRWSFYLVVNATHSQKENELKISYLTLRALENLDTFIFIKYHFKSTCIFIAYSIKEYCGKMASKKKNSRSLSLSPPLSFFLSLPRFHKQKCSHCNKHSNGYDKQNSKSFSNNKIEQNGVQ